MIKKIKKEKDDEYLKAVKSVTGIVIDSGDGVTHIVPVCDGYVLGSNIKHIPIAGRKISRFMMEMIKDRNENIKSEDLLYLTMEAKENYGYLCNDIVKEFAKFDEKSYDEITKMYNFTDKKFKKMTGIGKISKQPYSVDLGYELFMGPEAFFSPEIIDKNFTTPLDELIDITVQSCPVDYRRRLYSNIVLSGGSTRFKNFEKRLQKELQKRVDNRLNKGNSEIKPQPINVNVAANNIIKQNVWFGAQGFSTMDQYTKVIHTREEYLEKGPSCCRFNPVFNF